MLLNCNSSLRVPPLPAYNLSNFDVILLLFIILVLPASLYASLSAYLQLHSFYTILGGTVK